MIGIYNPVRDGEHIRVTKQFKPAAFPYKGYGDSPHRVNFRQLIEGDTFEIDGNIQEVEGSPFYYRVRYMSAGGHLSSEIYTIDARDLHDLINKEWIEHIKGGFLERVNSMLRKKREESGKRKTQELYNNREEGWVEALEWVLTEYAMAFGEAEEGEIE